MDRGFSRSLPFLPRYHSVSPVRAPRKFSSTRSLSQPSQRIVYVEGERSRLSNHYTHQPPHSPRHLSPFHSLTSPAPKDKSVKVFLLNTRLNTPLFRKSKSNSWHDINSSHVYSSLESLHNHQKRMFHKPGVVTTAGSCDDIYHKGPFYPDASHSESGISLGESEEDGREEKGRDEEDGDETDAASQYSYASSSAFFETTMESEYERGESDNDVFSPDEKSSHMVVSGNRSLLRHHGSDRASMVSPLSSYAEARRRELMSSPSWEFLDKMSPARQLFTQNPNSPLKVVIPESEHNKTRNGSSNSVSNGDVSTPLAQSTPHVSPRSFYGPPLLSVKGVWNADSLCSDSAISSRAMSSLSENDSNSTPNSRSSSFSEDYNMMSDIGSPKSKAERNIKPVSMVLEKRGHAKGVLKSTSEKTGKNGQNNNATHACISDGPSQDNPDIYVPPLESVIDLDESTLAATSYDEDEDETTPRAGQWWAVYNIESAKARKEAGGDEDGGEGRGVGLQSNFDFRTVDKVKVVKPVKTGIPLISAGKYGQEKLKKASSPPPERNEQSSSRRRSLTYPLETSNGMERDNDSGNVRGISPPLLSLSPKLSGRIEKQGNSISQSHIEPDSKQAAQSICQGKESRELIQTSYRSKDNIGNLPCYPNTNHDHDSKEQQGVFITPLLEDHQVTSGLNRSNASISVDGCRCGDMSSDKSDLSHGQQTETFHYCPHKNNDRHYDTCTVTGVPSLDALDPGNDGADRRTDDFASNQTNNNNNHDNSHGHYLLDNSDRDSFSLVRNRQDVKKVGETQEAREITTTVLTPLYCVDSKAKQIDLPARDSDSTCSDGGGVANNDGVVAGSGDGSGGGGGGSKQVLKVSAVIESEHGNGGSGGIGNDYGLPVDGTKGIARNQIQVNSSSWTSTASHPSFGQSQPNKGESNESHTGYFGVESVSDSGNCEVKLFNDNGLGNEDDFSNLNDLDFDKRLGSDKHTNIVTTSCVDSPRLVKLCEDFKALSLSDLDPDATLVDDVFDQTVLLSTQLSGRAPESVDIDKGNKAGNENVNINIDRITASKATEFSIRKEPIVVVNNANTNTGDVSDSILSGNVGKGGRQESRADSDETNSMPQCRLCGKTTNKSNVLSSLSCLNCHREEKRNLSVNGNNEDICFECSRSHSTDEIDNVGLSDEKIDGEEGKIKDEVESFPDSQRAITTDRILAVSSEVNNEKDSNESIDDEILFDIRDNKIVLTLSTTPGNIISIRHTSTPIHNPDPGSRGSGVDRVSGGGGGSCIDDSPIAQGGTMESLHYNSKLRKSVAVNGSSDKIGDYEGMIIPSLVSEIRGREDYQKQLLQQPSHYHSNDYSSYKGRYDVNSGEQYCALTDGIPKDQTRGSRLSADVKSDCLWQQEERVCQDYHSHYRDGLKDMRSRDGSESRIIGLAGVVIDVNGDVGGSINLSSSLSPTGGNVDGGLSASIGSYSHEIIIGDNLLNKGIPQQDHAPKVEGEEVGLQIKREGIQEIITDAQKDKTEGEVRSGEGGVIATALKSTTSRRQSGNNGRDSEFLLQRENGHNLSLSGGSRTPVTAVDRDERVNNPVLLCGTSCDRIDIDNATTTTRIVKKIHRKTVEETVTIERTVNSATSCCENKRRGVFIDNINSGGCRSGGSGVGQLLTHSGGEDIRDGHVLDCVKSSTERRETEIVIEEKLDYNISTCDLSNSNYLDYNKTVGGEYNDNIEINIDDVNGTVNKQTDSNAASSSNVVERLNSTNALTSGPLNPYNDSYTNSSSHYGDDNHLNVFPNHPEDLNNNNNIVNANLQDDSETMRGDKNSKILSRGSGNTCQQSYNHSLNNVYHSHGFEPQHNLYDKPTLSPGTNQIANQNVLDTLHAQLASISNGVDGDVSNDTINVSPSTSNYIGNIALHQRKQTRPITATDGDVVDGKKKKKCKTYQDRGQALTYASPMTQLSHDASSKYLTTGGVSGLSGHDILSSSTNAHQYRYTNDIHNDHNGMSPKDTGKGGQISSLPNMECVTGAVVSLNNNKSNQNTTREGYDNTHPDYEYITDSSRNSPSSHNLPRNNHHNLVLLKPGHAVSSSLWTLQEETESLLDGLSPKQTTTSPNNKTFRHSFSMEFNPMNTNSSTVVPSTGSNGKHDVNYLPPPVEFMDDDENMSINSHRDLFSNNFYDKRNNFSDYSEIDQIEGSRNYSSNEGNSVVGQGSSSIDQEVAKSLSDIETTLRALNGDSKFDYSSKQRPGEASFSQHVPSPTVSSIDNSFHDFVSGLGAGNCDFTFDFANKSHAAPTNMSPGNFITSTDSQHRHAPPSIITTPRGWNQQNETHGPYKSYDNRSSSNNNNSNIDDPLNSSIASSSNLSSNQDTLSDASSRLQILDLDLSRISSCASPSPSDFSDGSTYTSRGTAEIKKHVTVSFDDDYDMLPAISTPRFVPSSTPRLQTIKLKSALKKPKPSPNVDYSESINDSNNNINKFNNQKVKESQLQHVEWAKQFDEIIEDFNNKTCRLGPDSEIAIIQGKEEDSRHGVGDSKPGEDLYKTFVNDDSEKKQNHVCIVDEPENINTFRFKRFLKKSHSRRNNKGKRIVRFLSRLSCVSESVHQQSSPEHINHATCTKKARLTNGNAYTTESSPLPSEREPVVLTASSASRLAHHYQRANSPTQFIPSNTKDDQSSTSSNQSLDSLRSRTDSAYSSVSESAILNSPQSHKTNLHFDSFSSSTPTPRTVPNTSLRLPSSSTRLVSHPDSAFSSMSESNTLLSTSSLPEDQTENYSSDMLSALSDVFDQLDVCEEEIDQELLNRLRYSHRSIAYKRTN